MHGKGLHDYRGMQKTRLEEAVAIIRRRDSRYDPDAYAFLRDALDHTVRSKREEEGDENPHLTGRELLFGFRDLALDEFGPMAATVLEIWGLTSSEDVGEMVFQLIEMGAFGKSDDDSREDFREVFTFEEAFREPFQPRKRQLPGERNRMDDLDTGDSSHMSQAVDPATAGETGDLEGQAEWPKSS